MNINDYNNLPGVTPQLAEDIQQLAQIAYNQGKTFNIIPDYTIKGGLTKNNTRLSWLLNIGNSWTIYYNPDYADVLPHEVCHVIDASGRKDQTSKHKDFKQFVKDIKPLIDDKYTLNNNEHKYMRQYYTMETEIFARFLNAWSYSIGLIESELPIYTAGDKVILDYYEENKEIINDYFQQQRYVLTSSDFNILETSLTC